MRAVTPPAPAPRLLGRLTSHGGAARRARPARPYAPVVACAFVVAHCSSGPAAGSASVHGTIGGATVQTADAVALLHTFGTGPGQETSLAVSITSAGGVCAAFQSGVRPGNLSVLGISVVQLGPSVPAASYVIGQDGGTAAATYDVTDASCVAVSVDSANTGSITLTSVSSSSVAGSFDLSFGADHVTGTFFAPVCAGSNPSPTCGH